MNVIQSKWRRWHYIIFWLISGSSQMTSTATTWINVQYIITNQKSLTSQVFSIGWDWIMSGLLCPLTFVQTMSRDWRSGMLYYIVWQWMTWQETWECLWRSFDISNTSVCLWIEHERGLEWSIRDVSQLVTLLILYTCSRVSTGIVATGYYQ